MVLLIKLIDHFIFILYTHAELYNKKIKLQKIGRCILFLTKLLIPYLRYYFTYSFQY
jgi:hypothetical protein